MTTITKELLKSLRLEINDALKPIAEKYGLDLTATKSSYTHNNFTMKLEGASIAEDGTVLDKDAESFKVLAGLYDLSPNDLGAKFMHQGKEFTITGLNPKSGKYPIIGKDQNGKGYKFGAETVKILLSKQEKPK